MDRHLPPTTAAAATDPAPAATTTPAPAATTRLDAVADRVLARRAVHHAVLGIRSGDGSFAWTRAGGCADAGDTRAMTPDTPYHQASVVKLVTATVVLQLIDEELLDLDTPLAAVLPAERVARLHVLDGTDHTPRITVAHLLGHTSGLPCYFLQAPRGRRALGDELADRDLAYDLDDVLDRTRRLRPSFAPQDPTARRVRARYSDTNYQLLGAIVEAVTATSYPAAVRARVFEPLGLSRSWFAGAADGPRPAPATAWAGDRPLDIPRAMASMAPDGGLIAPVDDVLVFLRALVEGRDVARPDTLARMGARFVRFGPPRDRATMRSPAWPIAYGLGLKRFRVPAWAAPAVGGRRQALDVVGHSGATGSWLFHCPALDLDLAGTVDQTTAAAVPYRLLPRLLRAATVGRDGGTTDDAAPAR